MKQVLIRQGQPVVEEVPAPEVRPGRILVAVAHSCISAGTELSGLKSSGAPLWKRAMKRPRAVANVIKMAATHGVPRTYSLVQGELQSGYATGYSAAGTVLEVGAGIADVVKGQRVACAGAQFAHHAEIVCVPRNLCVVVPEGLRTTAASTVTLGAIALQGVRRAQPTLGETFVVIGLGILGQLATQMLRANGCRVIGIDLDAGRVELAETLGLSAGLVSTAAADVQAVYRHTGGVGADGVIVTAATHSDAVISTAFQMCRRKGRVVLIGDVGLNLNREDIYRKELDFFISCSYGPGRYDTAYEEEGIDYPIGYVRWTENRNMAEYLLMLAEGSLRLDPLIQCVHPVEEAPDAYARLSQTVDRRPIVLLSYAVGGTLTPVNRTVPNPLAPQARAGRVRVALVGPGGFARGTHLPLMNADTKRYHLQAIMSRNGHTATATAKQFAANYATTDYQRVLEDTEIDAVMICTRHDSHAALALRGLQAGKHVFVEKPLALTREDADQIQAFYADATATRPLLLTGFNRRFSPYAERLRRALQDRSNPVMLNYRMNAGYVAPDHWVHSPEGGGRNLGEACHIYDLFTFLTGAKVAEVRARAILPRTSYYGRTDNFVATVSFHDGSLATLTYTALGHPGLPKERLEVFCDGTAAVLDDYRRLEFFGGKAKGERSTRIEKGHREELDAFACAILEGGEWPIPLWQQLQATEIALRVEEQIGGSR